MRDYYQNPLKKGEPIPKDELEYFMVYENKSIKELEKLFNTSKDKINKYRKLYRLKKTKEQILEIRKKSNLQKYGVEFASQLPEKQEKMSNGLRKRYDNEHLRKQTTEKRNNTMLQKYGIENPLQSKQVWDKIKKNNLEKYGVEFVTSTKEHKQKVKQSVKEKYGVDNVSQAEQIKKKKEQTFLKHYGSTNYVTSKFYDIEQVQRKRYQTLKKNNTFSTSQQEKIILEKLQSKFTGIKTNYKTKEYPFHCDFYIPELNLYIEYQGHISHGPEPFNINNNEHLILVNRWLLKSQQKNFKNKKKDAYRGYVLNWVIRDRKKRKAAKENNLNWIEFFSLEEFETWFNKL